MKVLISNDDGIESNGIKVLAEKLSNKGNNVLVVAPSGNRSACSHSLTIGKSIKLKEENIKGCNAYSISGTPADCVKFSKLVFKDFDADCVVAGINKGHNIGSDILYSGTVAIACEAAYFGNVSFAFSSFSLGESDFNLFSDYAIKIIEELLPCSSAGDIWNVNFPDNKVNGVKGVKITPLGKQLYSDRYEIDKNGDYVLVGSLLDYKDNPLDCDVEWIKKGYITITPILFNKTNYDKLNLVKDKCIKL